MGVGLPETSKVVRRAVRVEDVAREAGVSPITVSRALSNPEKVRAETRQKVEEAVARTGYVVNRFASTLRSGRSTLIPVFVPSLENPHVARAVQGCIDALDGSRYHVLMAQTGASEQMQATMLAEVLPFRPAALVFNGMIHSEKMREQLRAMAIPVMEMWELMADPIDMMVGLCNRESGSLLGKHFRQRRFTKVAYVGRTTDGGAVRMTGFAEAFGRNFDHVLQLADERSFNDGMLGFAAVMKALPDCDAILFGSDVLAVGAMLQARKMHIPVPGQVAIAGYGDLEFAPHISPSLTTVHVSAYDMGRLAGTMLRKKLGGEAIPETKVVTPVRLECRDSTRR